MLFRIIDPANRSRRILPLHLQRLRRVDQYPEFSR
jgi:hypothetical protein